MVRASDGIDLATWDLGGDGPPLLLTHATGFHGRCWLPLGSTFASRFHVWAYDHRGHGASGHSASGDYRDWSRFVDDCLAVVDALGIHGAVGAGHSLGGAVLLLAEQRRPGSFGRLYCYEPIVVPDQGATIHSSNADLAAMSRKRRTVFTDRDAAWENYRAKLPFSRFTDDALACYVAYGFVDQPDGTVALACSGDEEATVYEGALHHTAYRDLPTLRIPVTVAAAGDGGTLGVDLLRDLVGRTAGSRLEQYDGLSHFGPMEDPDRVAAAAIAALAP